MAKRMYDPISEVRRLQAEVSDLKRELDALRLSRKILLNLVTAREESHRLTVQQLELSRKRWRSRKSLLTIGGPTGR